MRIVKFWSHHQSWSSNLYVAHSIFKDDFCEISARATEQRKSFQSLKQSQIQIIYVFSVEMKYLDCNVVYDAFSYHTDLLTAHPETSKANLQ